MSYAWIPVVIVVLALGIYLVARLVTKKPDDRKALVDEAKTEVAEVKAKADAQLAAELEKVDADVGELNAIKEITDDAARLQALADYGNRRRR